MFNKELRNLTLTSDIANDVFPNISGQPFGNDNSFLATLRALVAPHMTSDDTLWLKVRVRNDIDSVLKSYSDEDGVRYLSNGIETNTIFVCAFNGTESSIATSMQYLDSAFVKVYEKFKSLNDLRVFVQRQADVRFYINEEDRSVAIFVANMDLRSWHYIQALTSRFLPWYFTDKPSEEEKNLALTLVNKTSAAYERMIEQYAERYDFRSKKIKKLLNGFENIARRQQLSNAESTLNDTERQINRNVEQYRHLIQSRYDLMIKVDGLKYQLNNTNGESEIADYFICNKHLTPIYVNEYYLEFIVSCYLENYDPEMYERIANNSSSYIYGNEYTVTNDIFIPNEDKKRFLDAIFSDDPILKIKMCAYYKIDLRGSVDSHSNYSYPQEFYDRIPNPHLQRHNCIGNHRPAIEECLRNGNNIGAIEQCVASAKSINVGESATFPYFLQSLFASGCKSVIELPDGTSCTPTKAFQWLIEQEKNKTEVSE